MTRPIVNLFAPPLAAPPRWMPTPSPVSAPSGGSVQAPQSQQQVRPVDLTQITGVVDMRFSYRNLLSSLSAVKLFRPVTDESGAVGSQLGVPLISRGFIAGMTYSTSENLTGGTARFTVHLDNLSTVGMDWVGSSSTEFVKLQPNQYPFAAGDVMDVRVTTSSNFAPTTTDIEVIVYVIYTSDS